MLIHLLFALGEVQPAFLHHLLQVLERHLITVSDFAVVCGVFLHRIVGEVDEAAVLGVLATVLEGTQPHVAFWEDKALEPMGHQHPHADVELVVMNQQGPLQILLDQEAVSLDDGRHVGDHPNVLVPIEQRLLLFLIHSLLLRRQLFLDNWVFCCLRIPLYVVN